jgi:hypothetical protein
VSDAIWGTRVPAAPALDVMATLVKITGKGRPFARRKGAILGMLWLALAVAAAFMEVVRHGEAKNPGPNVTNFEEEDTVNDVLEETYLDGWGMFTEPPQESDYVIYTLGAASDESTVVQDAPCDGMLDEIDDLVEMAAERGATRTAPSPLQVACEAFHSRHGVNEGPALQEEMDEVQWRGQEKGGPRSQTRKEISSTSRCASRRRSGALCPRPTRRGCTTSGARMAGLSTRPTKVPAVKPWLKMTPYLGSQLSKRRSRRLELSLMVNLENELRWLKRAGQKEGREEEGSAGEPKVMARTRCTSGATTRRVPPSCAPP